ncbi:signal peptidase I [Phytophthora nicotianae P10297]|uniref:Signal peptidase I n=5 Tax=Phytophthora nicotianae TaxID=4792 RepID=W2Q042_PHYN3|nr:signal peptidase I [Phytophthora nicotianae INRA-310]ETI42470.1 signal peptidase I [Phytophthora nicotianae P1569]ETL35871.1 signal peptidase I [Phytophthora nicotianae]ETO71089.1 signal peptidase I [Phytophthora nicotianae P1976]ETP40310.1 signal peptidase I [Phytophthora nicotianae P10297]KUF88849.1 Mitochondrial inner membrane protease subunit 1 [Phytophthora nicotianae]
MTSANRLWLREASLIATMLMRFGGVSYCLSEAVDIITCSGPSMLPTLNRDGDILLLDKLSPKFWKLQPGEVVIAKSVSNPRRTVCKRIIGQEGDTVCVRSSSEVEFHRIPKGHVWLEGDNKYDSHDSRFYGPVPRSMVEGRVLMRIWPLNQIKRVTKEVAPQAFRER